MLQKFETFGKYILLEKIQTGGMAEIYLARRPGASGVSKFLAIKRILPQFCEQVEFIDMFKDEAKIAVNLSHANIVSIHEFGMEKNQLFLAMDYVEGRNLRQILNKMKKSGVSFSIEQVLYVIKEVAGGLDHAHRCIDANTGKPLNIIHRDMSPQNIMVSFEGEVKVVDFGIAKAETQLDTTRAGTLKGKFGYMSPEQAEGQNVDLRTDIFALGIVLWELLANDRLFVANNEINTLRKVRDCQVPSLRKINPNIQPELERIVSKVLAKDRNLRYQTAAALHRELSRFLNRQFPDFSPHDFSVFIKTLFASEILDSRKKMIDYSKAEIEIAAPPAAMAELPEPSNFTTSQTNTEATFPPTEQKSPKRNPLTDPPPAHARYNPSAGDAKSPPPPPNRTKRSGGQDMMTNSKMGTGELAVDRTSYRDREPMTGSQQISNSGTRSYSGLNLRSQKSNWSSAIPVVLIGFGLVLGTLAFAPSNPRMVSDAITSITNNPGIAKWLGLEQGRTEISSHDGSASHPSVLQYNVGINSEPANAVIEVDGKPIGATPDTFKWDAHSTKKVVVHLPGYAPQEREVRVDSNMALEFRLLAEKTGRLDINVVGSGKIYIDDRLVSDSSPYSARVKAGQEHVVKAIDSLTNVEDEWRGVVAENEQKHISLLPGKIVKRQGSSIKK